MKKIGAELSKLTPEDAAAWVARYVTTNTRPGDDYQPDVLACPRCKGAGLLRYDVPVTDERFWQTVECTCAAGQARIQRAIARRFGAAQLPPEYRTYPWRDHPDRAAVASVLRWADDPKDYPDAHHWLLVYGANGVGKTTMVGGLAAEMVEAGDSVIFRPMPELLADVRATFGKPDEQEALRQMLRRTGRLFLDDMGTEIPRDWVGEFLYEVLNHRHNQHLTTVITTNLDLDEMADYFGPRIWGRVKRMAEPIEMDGEDLRDLPHPTR